MKAVILAGGMGTRLSEETSLRPKPMVEIGGKPILWHIMKIYAAYGVCDFILCLGYKGHIIKEYFLNYSVHSSDISVDLRNGRIEVHRSASEPWTVTLVDTGEATMTGGRLKRIAPLVGNEEFLCTYGDGVGDVDIGRLIELHRREGRIGTVTASIPPGRFGALDIQDDRVAAFTEKPVDGDGWINAGFFVFRPAVFDFIDNDETSLEAEPLQFLAAQSQLSAYRHRGFWQPMDTLRDKRRLEELWASGQAPWKIWP